MNINDIETNVSRFLSINFPLWSVIRGLQNQPKISGKQISFYIENINNIGDDVWIAADDITTNVDYQGTRELPISLVFTGVGAMQSASDFLDFLRKEETAESLYSYGFINVVGTQPVRIAEIRELNI